MYYFGEFFKINTSILSAKFIDISSQKWIHIFKNLQIVCTSLCCLFGKALSIWINIFYGNCPKENINFSDCFLYWFGSQDLDFKKFCRLLILPSFSYFLDCLLLLMKSLHVSYTTLSKFTSPWLLLGDFSFFSFCCHDFIYNLHILVYSLLNKFLNCSFFVCFHY